MDAISIGIIVTVLSLGSALVFLFKKDYECRQRPNQILISSSINKKSIKYHDTKASAQKLASNVKQVPLSNATNLVQNNTHKLVGSAKKSFESPEAQTPQSQVSEPVIEVVAKIDASKANQSQTKVVRKKEIVESATKAKTESSLRYEVGNLEPSSDELDSSVLLGVFNSGNNKVMSKNLGQKSSTSQPQVAVEKGSKKKKTGSSADNSVEKILNIIASSHLSRDEIELAIQSLLNRLDSGDSNWQQPKNDPLQRLKNQLRDTETALVTEISNHELTRKRLVELKSQSQNDEIVKNRMRDEIMELQKESNVVHRALEQVRNDLNKHQVLNKQLKEESSQVIGKLEQDKSQLQSMLGSASSMKDGELGKLRAELDDKSGQVQRYELSNQAMGETIQKLEVKLRNTEHQLDQLRQSKQHADYDAHSKISELESERLKLEKSVQDHATRLKEVSDNNNLLEKSVNELQVINNRQEEMLKRLRDERHVNEASMKRTLCEMEQELKELQSKLSANTASNDDKLRKELSQVEVELNNAGQREKKLLSEMRELRDGLSYLLPEHIKSNDVQARPSDWVQHYLATVKQLAKTVDELKEMNNNVESPSKNSVDKSTLTLPANGANSRADSPISNGRVSKARSHSPGFDGDKKIMETKLLESNEQVAKLQESVQKLEEEKEKQQAASPPSHLQYEQQIKSLKMERNKLEAQIKIGLDSLRMEQERVRFLEEQLSQQTGQVVKT